MNPPKLRAVGSFGTGVADVFRGLQFLMGHPSLWIWAALPFLINVAIFAGMLWFGWGWAHGWLLEHFFNADKWYWSALGWLAGIVFWIAATLAIWFAFIPIATLVASPFNDLISEGTEKIYRGASAGEGFSVGALLRGLRVGMATSLRLALKLLFLYCCIFPLNFLPVIGNGIAAALGIYVSVRYCALQFTAYAMDRRLWSYKRREDFLRANRARTMGLGAMACLWMAVPFVNAFFIPVSAVAGTLLFCDAENN